MGFQVLSLATAEIAQLFCKSSGEGVAVGQHVIRQHMHGSSAFIEGRLREPCQEGPRGT